MADGIVADAEASGIYQIRNLVNGKRYVGSAVTIRARWATHLSELRSGKHKNRYLLSSWRKYGERAFLFEVLENCPRNSLIEREQFWMDCTSPEYNLSPTAGSCLGVKHSEETRRKCSERHKGNKYSLGRKMTQRCKDAIIRANRARKGVKRDPTAVERTAAAHRGMKRRDETRQKISLSKLGKRTGPRSEEHRANISKALKGRRLPDHVLAAARAAAAAKVWTDEERAAVSESLRHQYLTGVRVREKSAEHAAKIGRSLATLTDEQVSEIRRALEDGVAGKDLADRYAVTPGTISRIRHRKIYKWVA